METSHPPEAAVHWRDDGTPASPRFGDVYRSHGGALAQARQIFLHGCGLLAGGGADGAAETAKTAQAAETAESTAPAEWAGAPRWAVLETGFGLGLNFLATWQAWLADAHRPRMLFYTAVEAHPPSAADLVRSAAQADAQANAQADVRTGQAALLPLADELARQWHGLLPGIHRLRLAGGRVQLTLAVGDAAAMLAQLSGVHDSLFLDGFAPARNPAMWSPATLQAAVALLRPGARAATWCVAREVRERLHAIGFDVRRVRGLPPKRHALAARYAPQTQTQASLLHPPAPARCAVIGGGLAGAATARALALRGWQVHVIDAAAQPAAGASGLPAGVVAPHVSPDDRALSRLSRAGVRATLASAAHLLAEGRDWGMTGVLERHAAGERRLPPHWPPPEAIGEAIHPGSLPASAAPTQRHAARAGLALDGGCDKQAHAGAVQDAQTLALWHTRAGWLRPAALVRAMLQTPGITWQGGVQVQRLAAGDAPAAMPAHARPVWHVLDAQGRTVAQAELVVIAAGFGSLALLAASHPQGAALPLNPLRGQVAYGPMPSAGEGAQALPPFPVNGHGSLIAHLPAAEGTPCRTAWWVTGSTFERDAPAATVQAADHAHNRQRLAELLPAAAAALQPQWDDARARAWAAVRATLPDRLPAVGGWQAPPPATAATAADGRNTPLPPQLLTGLGARGLSLSLLCADLLAAWLHGEPLPIEAPLANQLHAGRWLRKLAAKAKHIQKR